MINRTILQGRLCHDPELRTTQSGVSVCSFRIAWSERRGERETKLFIQCQAWRGAADFIAKYFQRGQEIAVDGRLETNEWTDKNGGKRSDVVMTVDNVSFCGPKRDGASGGSHSQDVPPPPDDTGLFRDGEFETIDDEQMPF